MWACNPGDGPFLKVPNYLAQRILAQIIRTDADYRLERGDEKGALEAITAYPGK